MPSLRWIYAALVAGLAFVALSSDFLSKTVQENTSSLANTTTVVKEKTDHAKYIDALRVYDLPKEFHVCRIDHPAPQYGAPQLDLHQSPVMKLVNQTFRYQCDGQPYYDYINLHLFPFVLERHKQDPTLQWGQRPSVLPSSIQNKKILIIGNSHTRQMAESLLCMYQETIKSRHMLNSQSDEGHAMQYTLQGNHTVTVLVNHPAIYSPKWQSNLEDYYLEHPLSGLDAIVLGAFNNYNPEYKTAYLWRSVDKYVRRHPEQYVNGAKQNHFDFIDLAQVYNGPIVWTSMMSLYKERVHEQIQQQMATLNQTRTNLRSVHARQHLPAMRNVSCSCPPVNTVATCITDKTDPAYENGHRCVGKLGGYPDLVAWDVVEMLWDVLNIM